MLAEFKEKTFEKYFGFELARLTNVTFSPDQCDEASLGFDDAFLLPWELLRLRLPHLRRRRWARMNGLRISEIDMVGDEISRRMPPFKFNLFVQYKRPEYLSRSSAAERSCWNCPYFRYLTTPHQQALLAQIEIQSNGRAATVYASPAFWRSDDLWNRVHAQSVVAESNIVNVGRLNGHGRFSYRSAGSAGKGHSDPVDIECPSIEQILDGGMRQDDLPFSRHIKRAARQVEDVVKSDDAAAQLLNRARLAILGYGEAGTVDVSSDSLSFALATIEAFSDVFDVSFYAMG